MLIDAHSHLQLSEFDADRADVIARMKSAGVKTITVGVDDATSRAALALAEQYPDCLWATVGTHPADGPLRSGSEASGLDKFNIDTLRELAAHPKAVGIGECGLDYYRLKDGEDAVKEKQKEVFCAHIAVAAELQKSLMIHCRPTKGTDDAYEDLVTELSNSNFQFPITVHFFVGSKAVAERLLALGCYFTFGGVITFARDYDEAIAVIPIDRIMAETDAPYVAPIPHRGKRNEPAYVGEVIKKLAELKGISFDEVARITTENTRAVWKID
jgi:TatD DNase family protein